MSFFFTTFSLLDVVISSSEQSNEFLFKPLQGNEDEIRMEWVWLYSFHFKSLNKYLLNQQSIQQDVKEKRLKLVFSFLKMSSNTNSRLCENHIHLAVRISKLKLSNRGLSRVYVGKSSALIGWFFSESVIACYEKSWN